MKYLFVFVLIGSIASCGDEGLTGEDKKWIEKKIVEISDSIHKSSLAQGKAPPKAPKELWTRTSLSLPKDYNVGSIKSSTFHSNVMAFYPIGWSLDGKLFAYMCEMNHGQSIVIKNVISNKDEELILYEFNGDETIQYYEPGDKAVEDFLRKYKICKHFNYQKGDSFQSLKNGNQFTFEVAADKQIFYNDGEWIDGNVEIYANMKSPETKRKLISTYTTGAVYSIEINGFIKSPFENKVIVLVSESGRGYEHETFEEYRVISCNLNVDSF